MQDGRWDPEQLERGYRWYKALEHQRRGWLVIRERVRDFLSARRWELRQPEHLERAARDLVDELLVVGALCLYRGGASARQCILVAAWLRPMSPNRHRFTNLRQIEIRY